MIMDKLFSHSPERSLPASQIFPIVPHLLENSFWLCLGFLYQRLKATQVSFPFPKGQVLLL